MKTAIPAALLCLCFGVQVLMTAADDSAQRAAELQMKRRIINKSPAAEFGQPVQHLEKK
jgi:predicted nucleic acid-binding Zn ribbon protein